MVYMVYLYCPRIAKLSADQIKTDLLIWYVPEWLDETQIQIDENKRIFPYTPSCEQSSLSTTLFAV